jgi:hypothetical protein
MAAEREAPADSDTGGTLNTLTLASDATAAPRDVRAIRDEIEQVAREAWAAGAVVDPHRVSRLADELVWAASFAKLFGGDPGATERFAAKVAETAELASLLRARVHEAA